MKRKRSGAKSGKKNPYYTPATWSSRLRQRLERGDAPEDCLRYSHSREQYPEEVREYIGVASKIKEATQLLSTLTLGSTAPLLNSVGEKLSATDKLKKIVDELQSIQPTVSIEIRDHLLSIVPKD